MQIVPASSQAEKRFSLGYTLTPAQAAIDAHKKRFTFIRAGRKFGKTRYSEYKALNWLGKPNAVHWHIAPTYKMARLISWASFKRMIPKEIILKVNDSDLFIELKNGSQLYLMGSDDKDSLRGPAPTSMTLEEAAYHKGDVWAEVLEPNLAVHKGPALFISTPKGFNWFRDLEDAAVGDPDWATFHYTIYDNPYIDKAEINRIKSKIDPRTFNQEYMAEYESSVGRVFFEFQDTERHVKSFPLPMKGESCARSVDWGMRDDCGMLWGIVRGKKLHIYRENADNALPATSQAQILLNRTPAYENVTRNIIGHDAARNDAQMQSLTVQWHFSTAGVRPLKTSSRKKDQSRAMLLTLITEDRLVIHPECKKLRKQLLAYSWKDTVDEKPETQDGNDDLVDSLHYMVELLQFDLFLSPRNTDREMTLEEMYAKIREEKKIKQVNRYKIEQEGTSNIPDFAGSPAGYL